MTAKNKLEDTMKKANNKRTKRPELRLKRKLEHIDKDTQDKAKKTKLDTVIVNI